MLTTMKELSNLAKLYPVEEPIYVAGAPGIGKSELAAQLAADTEWLNPDTGKKESAGLIVFEMATKDPTDMGGCPWYADSPLLKDGVKVTKFAANEDLMRCTTESLDQRPYFVLFDDLAAADEQTMNSSLGIMLRRMVGMHRVRDNVRFMATGNRVEDKAGARELTSALANRFHHFDLKVDPEGWCDWAITKHVVPEIVSYIRKHMDQLHVFDPSNLKDRAYATPRSVYKASNIQKAIGIDHPAFRVAIAGSCGEAWSLGYKTYITQTALIVPPEDIFKNPESCEVPDRSAIDITRATTNALVYAIANKPDVKRITAGLTYGTRIHQDEMGLMLVQDIMSNVVSKIEDVEISTEVTGSDAWAAALEKFEDIIN